jgi:hypothetical protein
MGTNRSPIYKTIRSASLLLFLPASAATYSQQPSRALPPPPPPAMTSDTDISVTRDRLITLLRMTPTLAEVVATDPSLLANQEYVARTNPELERFIEVHPEIARNPDFYLFADLPRSGGRRNEQLMRKVWQQNSRPEMSELARQVISATTGFLAFFSFAAVVIWLTRAFLQNRRWSRVFKMQSEVHNRLIERFGTNEELLTYMNTDAGKRFLEAAPIPVDFEQNQRVPVGLSRVLLPLQAGIVLTLIGIGLLWLRSSLPDIAPGLLVAGTLILMPGIGFILSAGITWLVAARFGLMHPPAPGSHDATQYPGARS